MCEGAPLEDGVYSGSRNRVALFAALLGPPERARDHLSHQTAITCRIVDTLTKQCRSHGKNQYKRYTMVVRRPVYFDPETVNALREVLDEAWDRLHPKTQAQVSKTILAERILKSAAKGERDRSRLITAALSDGATT